MTSSNRSSNLAEAEYPLLVEIADYLEKLHGTKEDISVIDTFASGTILCNIVADFIGTEFIDDYHQDAKSFSQQADDNYSIFSVACEKIQIPRSCVATASDFKNKNYKKIELTFVLFVVRGMAYGLPHVPDELAEKLNNYQFSQYPEQKKDLQVCNRILDIYRNYNNDKDLPIEVESISDSDSGSDDEMKRTGFMNEVQIDKLDVEDKQQSESEAEAPTEASSDSDHSSEAEAPTEASNSEDDSKSGTRTTPSKHSTLTAPLSIVSGDVKQRIQESIVDSDEDVDEYDLNQNPGVNPSSSKSSGESEGEAPTEASNSEDDSRSGTRTTPSKHSTLNRPLSIVSGDVKQQIRESIIDSDEQVDEVVTHPNHVDNPSSSKSSGESEGEAPSEASSDGVDEVPLHHPEPEPEPEPKPEPKPEPHDIRQGPRVLVIPREPEVITQSNDPVGFDVNPHETEEEKREREERERQRREKKEEAKKRRQQQQQQQQQPVVQPEVSLVPIEKLGTAVTKPQKRLVKWYIVALFIVLMLICLACSIICGVFLAKINK